MAHSRCLFSDKYKTHKYSVGRAYSCWMLNWCCITWPVGFKRLINHLCFMYALLMFSNSLKMMKIDRNMSDLWQIVCKKVYVYYKFNFGAFFGFVVWIETQQMFIILNNFFSIVMSYHGTGLWFLGPKRKWNALKKNRNCWHNCKKWGPNPTMQYVYFLLYFLTFCWPCISVYLSQ